MTPEDQILSDKEPNNSPTIVGLEGLAGCGKSHIASLVQKQYLLNREPAEIFKIGGLGEDMKWLRKIRASREELYRQHLETPEQMRDRALDRVYHLASVKQSKILLKTLATQSPALVILDRTPFVGYAYAKAQDPSNPYLEEIYQRNLEVSRKIGMHGVIYLDLSAEEAFARSFARYYMSEPNPLTYIDQAIAQIKTPPSAAETIRTRSLELIQSGIIKPKGYENWHFPLFEFLVRHRVTFQEALERGQKDLGFDLRVVNAEQSLEHVGSDTLRSIQQVRANRTPNIADHSFVEL